MGKGFKGSKGFKGLKNNEVANPETTCETEINNYRDVFYTELQTEIKNDEDLAPTADCLVDELKKYHFAEVSMKKYVYQNMNRLSRRKRKKALKAIDYALEKKMETALKLCLSDEMFGDLFDELYASANETDSLESSDFEEDYCVRKYMVDNDFINTTLYNVNLNPENIETANLKCDDFVKSAMEEIEDALKEEFESELDRPSRRATKCMKKTIRSFDFFVVSFRVVAFGEVGLTDEAKAAERSKFIELMKNLYEQITKC